MLHSERESLIEFVQQPDNQGPELLQGLIGSVKRFYNEAGTTTQRSPLPVLESLKIRSEMYKLFYR